MPKYVFRWKDPDAIDLNTGETWYEDLPVKEYHKLRALGVGEYVTVEVDTDLGTSRIYPPKPGG